MEYRKSKNIELDYFFVLEICPDNYPRKSCSKKSSKKSGEKSDIEGIDKG
jgi:hypothetical protein